jgi:hypothetical protein
VVKTHTGKTSSLGQLAASLTSSPLEGPPRQVSVSHEKSGPGWHVGPDAQRERHHRRATITSPSSPTLPHASSARGTQAPSTMCTSLDLDLGVAS